MLMQLILVVLLAAAACGALCVEDAATWAFRNASLGFLVCLGELSLPARYCAGCRDERSRASDAFESMSDTCKDYDLFHSFSSNMIDETWTTSHCDDCRAADLADFREAACDAINCLANSTACTWGSGAASLPSNMSVDLCTACGESLDRVSQVYDGLSSDCRRATDITEQQKVLQHVIDDAGCVQLRPPWYAVLSALLLVIVPPLLFYVAAFYIYRKPASPSTLQPTPTESPTRSSPQRTGTQPAAIQMERAPLLPRKEAPRPAPLRPARRFNSAWSLPGIDAGEDVTDGIQ
eukprot:m.265513 g.265513  ORF g.265513 m.265513 type:complete len:293 (-) comp29746_c0_seq1:307-1185(-)